MPAPSAAFATELRVRVVAEVPATRLVGHQQCDVILGVTSHRAMKYWYALSGSVSNEVAANELQRACATARTAGRCAASARTPSALSRRVDVGKRGEPIYSSRGHSAQNVHSQAPVCERTTGDTKRSGNSAANSSRSLHVSL
jgi:hypothetical protein